MHICIDNSNPMTISINNPNNPYMKAMAGVVGKSNMTQGQKALLQFLRFEVYTFQDLYVKYVH